MGRSSLLTVGVCLIAPLLVVGASADEACASNADDLKSSCIPSSKLVKDSSLLSTKTQLLKKGTSAETDAEMAKTKKDEVASAETDLAKNLDTEAQMPTSTAQPTLPKTQWSTKTQVKKKVSPEGTLALNLDNQDSSLLSTETQLLKKGTSAETDAEMAKTKKEEVASAETDLAKNLDTEAQMPTSTAQPTLPKTQWSTKTQVKKKVSPEGTLATNLDN